MLRKKLFSIIKKIAISLVLVFTLVTPFYTLKAYEIPKYNIKESSIVYKKQQVLIYSTHSEEEYKDGYTVIDAGEDLAKKLEDKGYSVTHVKENFSKDYNKAYTSSREYLEGLTLDDYSLIIDLHRDATESENTTNIYDVDVARCMMVYSKASGNYDSCRNIGNSISENLLEGIKREDIAYNRGLGNFNQDLSNKSLLIEVGNNNNDMWQVKRACTHLANAIDEYLKGE